MVEEKDHLQEKGQLELELVQRNELFGNECR